MSAPVANSVANGLPQWEAQSTDVVTLQFTVPAELRHILDMELELLRHQMDPVVAWLERNGGGVSRSDTL